MSPRTTGGAGRPVLTRVRKQAGRLSTAIRRGLQPSKRPASGNGLLPTPADLTLLQPFTNQEFDRPSDRLRLRVAGTGVSVVGGRLVPTPGTRRSTLTVEIATVQHWAEPAVAPSGGLPKDGRLVAADPTNLVVVLRPNDQVPRTLEGVLTALQTHVLATDSRVSLPAKVLLGPKDMVVADDVPIEPADAAADGFRERWHFALRTLSYPVPHLPRRSDETRWQAYGTKSHFTERPSSARPTPSQLVQVVQHTADGIDDSLLKGNDLVLSGGGASGLVQGSWPSSELNSLTLYRERFVTGRTTCGETANDGILYPFGLLASEIISWQRELRDEGTGLTGAYLVTSAKIILRRMSRDISTGNSPFTRVEVVNPVRDGVPTFDGDEEFGHPVPLISYIVTDRNGVRHRLEAPGYFLRGGADPDDRTKAVARMLALYTSTSGDATTAEVEKHSPRLSQAFVGTHGERVTYLPGGLAEASTVFTQSVRFRLPSLAADDLSWFADDGPRAEVDWFLAELSDVAEFTGSPATTVLRYSGRKDVLLEPVEPIDVRLRSAVGSGAFGSPSYQVNSITTAGAVFRPATAAASPFPASKPPKLLGLFDLTDFLDVAKVPLASPSITTQGAQRALSYATPLSSANMKKPTKSGGTKFLPITLTADQGSTYTLTTSIGPETTSSSTITNVAFGLGGLIMVPIPSCTILQDRHGVHLSGDLRPPQLVGQFSLIQEVLDSIPPALFNGGPSVAIRGGAIVASVVLDLPAVAFGIFAVRNLTFRVTVSFLLGGGGVQAEVSLGSPERPFQVGAGIFVGGGWFALGVGYDGTKVLPRAAGAIELGAGVSIDLALASGTVEAVAGLSFVVFTQEDGSTGFKVGGYVRVVGSIKVKYIGSMSVRAMLALEYDSVAKKVTGSASITVEIDVWLLSTSFSVGFTYSFRTSNSDPPLLALLATSRGAETEWQDYWAAFGPSEELVA